MNIQPDYALKIIVVTIAVEIYSPYPLNMMKKSTRLVYLDKIDTRGSLPIDKRASHKATFVDWLNKCR